MSDGTVPPEAVAVLLLCRYNGQCNMFDWRCVTALAEEIAGADDPGTLWLRGLGALQSSERVRLYVAALKLMGASSGPVAEV